MTPIRTKTVTITTILVAVVGLSVLLAVPSEVKSPRGDTDARGRSGVDLMARVTDYTARFTAGSGYTEPSQQSRETVARGVTQLLDGRRTTAQRTLGDVDFTVRTVTDGTTGRRYTEIADRSDDGPAPRGWGRVYIAQDGTAAGRRWVAQVPHPVADRNTERLGVGVLRGARGGILMLAGAHRAAGEGNAADVAHREDTVFEAVWTALAERGLPAVQVHGFADDSAPRFDVIPSTGRGSLARPEGRSLADALADHGFTVCRAWTTSCPLAGRTNIQGRTAADRHVPFLHVEFNHRTRTDKQRTARAVEAVGRVTNLWQKGERP
ncbi:hypothetical protein [Streptomyces sp. BH055]|uniref:hypothetical protein n=1 Tax=unclassified Streptomyces TaxID=2593676 RepID=UPI003BB65A12